MEKKQLQSFSLRIAAWREGTRTRSNYYGIDDTETTYHNVTEQEIYEAISKYLQVKGFQASTVHVEVASEEDGK